MSFSFTHTLNYSCESFSFSYVFPFPSYTLLTEDFKVKSTWIHLFCFLLSLVYFFLSPKKINYPTELLLSFQMFKEARSKLTASKRIHGYSMMRAYQVLKDSSDSKHSIEKCWFLVTVLKVSGGCLVCSVCVFVKVNARLKKYSVDVFRPQSKSKITAGILHFLRESSSSWNSVYRNHNTLLEWRSCEPETGSSVVGVQRQWKRSCSFYLAHFLFFHGPSIST